MRIACLQFGPELGQFWPNIDRANAILERSDPQELDLLVLPELAFAGSDSAIPTALFSYNFNLLFSPGYNHPSLSTIGPYLEHTCHGPSTHWAKTTAARLKCIVTVSDLPDTSVPLGASESAKNFALAVKWLSSGMGANFGYF